MSKTDTATRLRIQPKTTVLEPYSYRVIYVNDDVTTQEFVIETLKSIFNYDQDTAEAVTMKIHEDGSAVVAVLPYEMAEQKGIEVTTLARSHGFPLMVKIEADK